MGLSKALYNPHLDDKVSIIGNRAFYTFSFHVCTMVHQFPVCIQFGCPYLLLTTLFLCEANLEEVGIRALLFERNRAAGYQRTHILSFLIQNIHQSHYILLSIELPMLCCIGT